MFDYHERAWDVELTQEEWDAIFNKQDVNTQNKEAQDDPATER